MKSAILLKLRTSRSSMTKSELVIVDKIIEDPNFFVCSSARDFSKAIGLSDATVIRFCQKYSDLKYIELKERLNAELIEETNRAPREVSPNIYADDDLETTIDKVQSAVLASLEDTKKIIDLEELNNVIRCIEDARRVFFVGLGGSGLTAIEAEHKFARIGVDVSGFHEKHRMFYTLQYIKPHDLLITISHSGETVGIVQAAQTAKQNGASVVAITHNKKSNLGVLSDVVLQNCSQGGFYEGDSIGIRTSQMYLIEVIYTELLKKNFDRVKSSKIKIKNKIY
ncbi:MurR/RpiR family transcriptional regulator [Vibrio hannami]|nr:MurR/RpiR family transcriptional regulator [Vibrio hannami]MDG3085360.1 MurR/RpiR family transcriptional regulator [Vibrio hannami]